MQPYPQPTHAPRSLSVRERHLGQAAPRERLRGGNSDVSNVRRTPNGALHAKLTTKMCTTLLADRNQRLDIIPPNALHRSISYRKCSRETRMISPGPIANGLTQYKPPAEASSSNSRRSTLRGRCTSAQDLASRKLPPWKMMCYAYTCLLYTSPSPRDGLLSRMPSYA